MRRLLRAFTDLRLPERRPSRGWMAAAAAAVMALGVGALWVSQDNPVIDEVAAQRTVSIRAIDFEASSGDAGFALIEAPDPDPAPDVPLNTRPVIIEETRVAAATPDVVQENSEPIFSGSFETGDFSEWVPST